MILCHVRVVKNEIALYQKKCIFFLLLILSKFEYVKMGVLQGFMEVIFFPHWGDDIHYVCKQRLAITAHHQGITSCGKYCSSLMTLVEFRLCFFLPYYVSVGLAVQVKSTNQKINNPETVYKWKASNELVITVFNTWCVLKCPYCVWG